MIEKVKALVMRTYALRDSSRIVHLLTAERGHLKVVAKGARGPRSRFGAALEPFTRIDAVIYYKPQRDLQLLSQADVVDSHRALSASVVRYAYACGVLELLEQLLGGEEGNHALFALIQEALGTLESAGEDALRLEFMSLVLRAVALQGYRPALDDCVVCKATLNGDVAFDAPRGGVVCRRCGGDSSRPLSGEARRLMIALLSGSTGGPIEIRAGDEVARVLHDFLRAHVPRYRRLRSMDVVRAAVPVE